MNIETILKCIYSDGIECGKQFYVLNSIDIKRGFVKWSELDSGMK